MAARMEKAAQHASHAVDQGHRAAHRIRTAIAWDGRNDAQRDDHLAEARVLLAQMQDAITEALAALDAPAALTPEQIRRADLVATVMSIAGVTAETLRETAA